MQTAARVLLALAYAGLAVLPFRGLGSRALSHVIGDSGDALLQHLHCAWQWLALAEGRFGDMLSLPTMAPYGSGLAFGEPLVGIVLPFAPIYLATGSSALAYNAAVLGSFPLLGIATFLLVRELTRSSAAGLLAGMLVLFPPWRIHYLGAPNVLTLHYAVFGMWLVARWLRSPGLGLLLLAALLFHVQLVTSAQNGVPAVYLGTLWLAVEWAGRRFAFEPRHCGELAAGGLLFVALSLPWLGFFSEAFAARSGQPPMHQMAGYSESFPEMARLMGASGALGIAASLGVLALPLGVRQGFLPRRIGWSLLGIGLAAILLFVIGRGPFAGSPQDAKLLPGYYLSQLLPLVGMFRAPIRLAGLTPVVLALLAGVGMAVLDAYTRRRWGARLSVPLLVAPMLCALTWPRVDVPLAAPIEQRPDDLALSRELARLPEDAHIIALPALRGLEEARIDERVLVHRRRQIGGFASVVPVAFRQLALALGDWPRSGLPIAAGLGATHVVVPNAWLAEEAQAAIATGHREVEGTATHAIFALPRVPMPAPSAWRLDAPSRGAVGRWITLALFPDAWHFEPRGHQREEVLWRRGDDVERVEATWLFPGVAGPHAPLRVHVPTPGQPGRYELTIPFSARPILTQVELSRQPTSFDLPVRRAEIALAPGATPPSRARAGGAIEIDVELRVGPGPLVLASSRHLLPERRGEALLLVQFRGRLGSRQTLRLPDGMTLARDLAPGETARLRWYVQTPLAPDTYDVYAKLVSTGVRDHPMPWQLLLRELEVRPAPSTVRP